MERAAGRALVAGAIVVALVAGPLPALASGPGVLSGFVHFENGDPAAGARVVLLPGGFNVSAGPDGSFAITVEEGNYTVRATAANLTVEAQTRVVAGETTELNLTVDRTPPVAASPPLFALVFLIFSMLAVVAGGFYVNKRMAEKGLDLNKTVVGGVGPRKPFRRRRHKSPPR